MNAAYRRTRTEMGMQTDRVGGDDLDSFSVEKARLRIIWLPMLLTCVSVIAFGWVLHYHKVGVLNTELLLYSSTKNTAYVYSALHSIHRRILHANRLQCT